MRKKQLVVLATAVSMVMGGCASQGSLSETVISSEQTSETEKTTEQTTETETETETEAVADYRSAVELRTDLISDEYMGIAENIGRYADHNAVADVMRKAANKEKVTIACIGGSITQGTISSGADDKELKEQIGRDYYANIVFEWWKTAYPDTEFEFVNAGIGATGSYLAVHRVAEDVLSKKPDLVVVEFAVNDAGVKNNQTTYENLCRAIRSSEGNPAVVLLMMGQTNGSSAQPSHQEVGLYYNLPMLSYNDMIKRMMADKLYTDKQLSGDTVHPSLLGHALVGEIFWKYFNNISAHLDTIEPAKPFDTTKEFLTSEKYMNCKILDSSNITPDDMGTFANSKKFAPFPNDWTSEEGDGGLTFTASFKNLGVMYYCITNGKGAKYDVYVDGEKAGSVDTNFKGGWGNYGESSEVYTSDTVAEHKVEFKKADDSTGDIFTLCGLLLAE